MFFFIEETRRPFNELRNSNPMGCLNSRRWLGHPRGTVFLEMLGHHLGEVTWGFRVVTREPGEFRGYCDFNRCDFGKPYELRKIRGPVA